MTKYLLPCSCGKAVEVAAGQAGQVVTCVCGAQLEVPTIRGLAALEQIDDSSSDLPAWGRRQAWILAGLLLASLGFGSSFYLYFTRPVLEEEQAQSDLDQLRPVESLHWWQFFEEHGINRPQTPQEQYILRWQRERWRWIWVTAALGVAGLVMIGVGLAAGKTGSGGRAAN